VASSRRFLDFRPDGNLGEGWKNPVSCSRKSSQTHGNGNSFAVDEDDLVAFIAVRVASGYSGRGRPKKPKEKNPEGSA
jgi:hypothetical protein